MTEQQFNEINNSLYDDAKIRECQGTSSLLEKTYTSNLWESLKNKGYTMENFKGITQFKDTDGQIVIQSVGVINALCDLGNLMR